MLDIIFLALIAGFIGFKLYKTIGQKDDVTQKQMETMRNYLREQLNQQPQQPAAQNTISTPNATQLAVPPQPLAVPITPPTHENPNVLSTYTAIFQKDNGFTEENFLSGAKRAFETILYAFNKGDKRTLAQLISPNLLQRFSQSIDERQSTNRYPDITLVGITEAKAVDGTVNSESAHVTIAFTSEQIVILRNSNGEIIEGNQKHIEKLKDMWIFARQLRDNNQEWLLIATRAQST
jgi:predicted lipid-binding transport protein (Tim44 family)